MDQFKLFNLYWFNFDMPCIHRNLYTSFGFSSLVESKFFHNIYLLWKFHTFIQDTLIIFIHHHLPPTPLSTFHPISPPSCPLFPLTLFVTSFSLSITAIHKKIIYNNQWINIKYYVISPCNIVHMYLFSGLTT